MNRTHILKKTVMTAVIFGASLATPMITFAQGTSSSLINSGDDASISNQNFKSVDVNVMNTNSLNSNQSMSVSSDTGHNDLSGNIGGSSLTTGAAVAQGAFSVTANSNAAGITGGTGMNGAASIFGQGSDVVNTGDGTHVTNNTSDTKSIHVSNQNTATVNESLNSNTDSGHNTLNSNIGGNGFGGMTQLTTGGSAVGANFQVTANQNQAAVDMGNYSSPMGNFNSLTNTGDDASVNNTSSSTSNTSVSNTNTAAVSQSLTGHSNSGYNDLSNGIGGSNLMTGIANFFGGFSVNANKNTAGVGQGGNFSGLANYADSINTGDGLDTNSNVLSQTNVNSASANSLSDYKLVSFDSNSGHNTLGQGIGNNGQTMTGASQGSEQMNVTANTNSSIIGSALDALSFLFR